MHPLCKHCSKRIGSHSRGLCRVCFFISGVRELFSVNPNRYFQSKDFNGNGKKPFLPTEYPPGSEGKILVMTGRADRNEQLFHPLDVKILED